MRESPDQKLFTLPGASLIDGANNLGLVLSGYTWSQSHEVFLV